MQAELDQLRAELGRLSHQLRVQNATQESPAAEPEREDANEDEPSAESPVLSPEQRAREIEEKVARRTAVLDSSLAREAIDQTWSDSVAAQASALIGPDGLQASELLQLECGSTMCKMRFRHRSVDEFEHMPETLRKVDHRFAYVRGEPHEGTGEMYTTVYLSREGHSLPK